MSAVVLSLTQLLEKGWVEKAGDPIPAEDLWQSPVLQAGLHRSSLIEVAGVCGSGKTESLLRVLRERPTSRIAWMEVEPTIYPCAFPQLGVPLSRLLFVEPEQDLLWSVQQVLQSGLFECLVLHLGGSLLKETQLRQLQFLARKSRAFVFVVTDRPHAQSNGFFSFRFQIEKKSLGASPEISATKFRWRSGA